MIVEFIDWKMAPLPQAAATGGCALKLTELVERDHRGLSYGVVAVDDTYLVLVDIVHIQLGCLEGVLGGHIGILCLLRHELSEVAVYKRFQVSLRHVGAEW